MKIQITILCLFVLVMLSSTASAAKIVQQEVQEEEEEAVVVPLKGNPAEEEGPPGLGGEGPPGLGGGGPPGQEEDGEEPVCEETYDYVVVGAGVAGCVFARRAAEEGHTVLLLERGGKLPEGELDFGIYLDPTDPTNTDGILHNTEDTRIPKMFPIGNPNTESLLSGEAPGLGNAKTLMFQGDVLAGGSAINAMIWVVPDLDSEIDDDWSGWTADDLRAGLDKAEGMLNIESNGLGTHYSEAIMDAGPLAGFEVIDGEVLDDSKDTIHSTRLPRKDGLRRDAFTAYINDADSSVKDRITYETNTKVDEIIIDTFDTGDRPSEAKGVIAGEEGTKYCGTKGVVMAAGALLSPALLEKSGVGDPQRLSAIHVEPKVENAQVGMNLQDHLGLLVPFLIPYNAPGDYIFNNAAAMWAEKEAFPDSDLFADTYAKLLVFAKVNDCDKICFEAELLEGLPFFFDFAALEFRSIGFSTISVDIESRGEVHYSGSSEYPLGGGSMVNANWGGDPTEVLNLAAGIKRLRELLAPLMTAESPILEILPHPTDPRNQPPIVVPVNPLYQSSYAEMVGLITATGPAGNPVFSTFHYSGSLSLGKAVNAETMEVIDDVKGRVKDLYVIDSSLVPRIPKNNPMALNYMVAEHASGIILNAE